MSTCRPSRSVRDVGHADAVEAAGRAPCAGSPSCWPRTPRAGRTARRAPRSSRPATASLSSSVAVASVASSLRTEPSSSTSSVPSLIAITSGPTDVEQRDAGRHQDLGTEVGVAPGDRGRRVDHGGGPARDERLGAHPVEVEVVDDRDVPGTEALGEVLGAPVDAGGTAQPRSGAAVSAGGKADGHNRTIVPRRARPGRGPSGRGRAPARRRCRTRPSMRASSATRCSSVDLVHARCG